MHYGQHFPSDARQSYFLITFIEFRANDLLF